MPSTIRRFSAFATVLLLTLVAFTAAPTNARAQTTANATAQVQITIPPVVGLSSQGDFNFPTVSEASYAAGYIASSSGPSIVHHGNVPYTMTIQSGSGTALGFTAASGRSDSDPNKPVSDLTVRATTGAAAGAYVPLPARGSPTSVYARDKRGRDLTTVLDGRIALDYDKDPPGTYSGTVLITIVAN